MLLGHAACVMNELPFSSYFWGCRGGSHDLQVFPAPAITLVCSWLRGRPRVFPAPVKTGLLLTREERDVCPTRLAPGGGRVIPAMVLEFLAPRNGWNKRLGIFEYAERDLWIDPWMCTPSMGTCPPIHGRGGDSTSRVKQIQHLRAHYIGWVLFVRWNYLLFSFLVFRIP